MVGTAEQLRAQEPVFHHLRPGCTRADVEAMTAADYWEVGASGTIYDREACVAILVARYARPDYDPMAGMLVEDFAVRDLGAGTWLATYRLVEDGRVTRRATVWHWNGARWVAQYHQGTVVASPSP